MSEHRLSEIVIERPRSGMRISLRKIKGYRQQFDGLTEEGPLSPYLIKPRKKTKYLSDHLGPLRRFLRSQVGQPWDEVYSKLCQRMDSSTMAGQHVLSHVWQYVERHVDLIDGIPYSKPHAYSRIRLDRCRGDQFYVHPQTGLLCASEKISRTQTQTQPRNVVTLDDHHQYHQVNEIWYLITFKPFPPLPEDTAFDVLQGLIARSQARAIGGQTVYAAQKRQCSKKEIQLIRNRLSNA